jgi:hypothetical protein
MQDLAETVISQCTTHPERVLAVYTIVFPSARVPTIATQYIHAGAYLNSVEWDADDVIPSNMKFLQYRVRVSHPVRRFVMECGGTSAPMGSDIPTIDSWEEVCSFSTADMAMRTLYGIMESSTTEVSPALFEERHRVCIFSGSSSETYNRPEFFSSVTDLNDITGTFCGFDRRNRYFISEQSDSANVACEGRCYECWDVVRWWRE